MAYEDDNGLQVYFDLSKMMKVIKNVRMMKIVSSLNTKKKGHE